MDWVLIIFETKVIKKKRPVRPVLPDYLFNKKLWLWFTQSIKFYYTLYYHVLRVQMFKKCDSSNKEVSS